MAQSPWTPISILGNYAQDVRELSFFDGTMHGSYPNYLSAAQMQSVFPGGFIVRPQFTFQGREYRLTRAKDPMTDRLLYLALETDDASSDSRPPSRTLFASPSFPTGGKVDPRRAPLQSHSPWNVGFDEQEQQPSAYPAPTHQQLDLPPRSHSANGYHHPLASPPGFTPFASGRETPTQPQFVPPTPFHSLIPHSHKFAQDMIVATSSQVPLERYKALVALMSILRREMQQGQVVDTGRPECWEAANALSLLKSIVLVGECLAKFGSADFNEGSNTVRAITTKDYATLLRQYLQTYGFIYNQDFIAGISDVALQDDMMTVCNLLQTRCEANDLLFGQLIKHVGLEGSSKGAATVYNSTVVTSSPTTTLTCNPTSTTTSTSSAQARLKSLTSGSVWPFVVAAGGGLAMLLLKKKLGGGGGRGGAGGEGGSKPRRKGRGSNIHSMLEGERLMVSTLASCQQELDRSRQNSELLENDWRLGKLRLASPHNPLPPGYKEVDTQRCDLQEFYRQMRHEALLHELAVSRDED